MRHLPVSALDRGHSMDPRNQMTLVWRLVHPTLPDAMECLAFRRDDGRVEVVIERGILQEAFGVFADTPTAVRTAFRFEAEMLDKGWQKVV